MSKAPYHHGDLRDALLDGAIELLDAEGVHAVTLREVARRVGVSHSAPYHHFADKDALLAAMTARVSRELGEALVSQQMDSNDVIQSARAVGVGYVLYAVRHPERFRLLNRGRVESPGGPTAEEQMSRTQNVVLKFLLESMREGQKVGLLRDGSPETLAVIAWATVHGLATLLIDGALTEGPPTEAEAERLAEETTLIVGGGLIKS